MEVPSNWHTFHFQPRDGGDTQKLKSALEQTIGKGLENKEYMVKIRGGEWIIYTKRELNLREKDAIQKNSSRASRASITTARSRPQHSETTHTQSSRDESTGPRKPLQRSETALGRLMNDFRTAIHAALFPKKLKAKARALGERGQQGTGQIPQQQIAAN